MARKELLLTDGWEFALGEPAEENFKEVFLPHDWAIDAPFDKNMRQGGAQGFRDRWNTGWYRLKMQIDDVDEGYRYFLDFGGIYEQSEVRMNGAYVGGRKYGYSPFRLDISEFICQGKNLLEIKVDNTAFPVDRWYSGCGIYRPVKLLKLENSHLDEREVVVKTEINGADALMTVQTGVSGRVRAILSGGGVDISAEGEGSIKIPVKGARLWSADEPNLYDLTLSLMDAERAADEITLRVGIRDIVMDPHKGMLVNGKPVKLQGVCLHQDVGSRGIASKKEIWRERLLQLKNMGCNSIRAAHHAHSAEFMDLCDEMGFYVYAEPFDKWTGGLYGRYFETEWQQDFAALIKRDRNRPCVFMWGVGNEVENQAQPSMLRLCKMLVEYAKSLDDTRPVCYAMNPHFKYEKKVDLSKIEDIQAFVDEVDEAEINDIGERVERIALIAELVDVIGCNYQEQWYELIRQRCPDKLILGTETYQFFIGHADFYQNMGVENPALVPENHQYVIGSMIWTGYDYLGESMGWPAKGWSGAPIRTNMEKRPNYYILQSYWSKKPMVHFSVMDYSLMDEGIKAHWDTPMLADHWHFPQFLKTVIPYVIASNCDEVRLWLNGKRYHVPAPADSPNRLTMGFLPWLAGTVTTEGYINGEKVCEHSLTTPGFAVELAFDERVSPVAAEKGCEMLLTVRAFDGDGNPCFRESGRVRFAVEGCGVLLAVDNGSLMHEEPYGADSIHMHQGVASVLIRLSGGEGRVAVRAFASGMQPAVIDIE
ncbi:MAG: glycoside hydrolase family 2 TIM barrel-domain containing protein [Christensenellales bacterium]|jgi:beta-galactosidase